MIAYVKIKKFLLTKKTPELSDYSKIAVYKRLIYKSTAFLYTNNE